jgi:hypothetical protein
MVNVDIKSTRPILPMEFPFIAHVLQVMSYTPEFAEEQQPFLCSGLRVSRSRTNENGEIEETEQMPFDYDRFVTIVKKAMETQIIISVLSENGNRIVREVPMFPVMLIDIPLVKDAGIVLTQVPEFEMKCEGPNIGFAFRGSLLEFVQSDVDEQADSEDEPPEE